MRIPGHLRLCGMFAPALLCAAPAAIAAPDPDSARLVFDTARTLCERDACALWGTSLCGPMMIVDPVDRSVLANQPDPGGMLVAHDDLYAGTLPADTMLANTRVE